MKKLILLLLLSNLALADEAFLGYGVGVFGDADSFIGQNKYMDLGYREFLFDGLYWQNKLGFLSEGGPDQTRKSGFWGSTGLGLEVDLQPLEIRGGGALGGISNPDSQLGGYFQFNENFSVGLRDRKGDGIAIEYNHLSCGPFCQPNTGRDFIILELSQKW